MQTNSKIVSRRFLGKTDNFVDKQEKAFEQRHLREYLKGSQFFQYGYYTDTTTGRRIHATHEVKQEYIYAE